MVLISKVKNSSPKIVNTKTLNPTILLKARPEHMYFNFVRIGGRISEGWEQLYIKENLN